MSYTVPASMLHDHHDMMDDLSASERVRLQHYTSRAYYDPFEDCYWAQSFNGGR